MQPLKITIPGEYWDSQLYRGRLYLFGAHGDIQEINWDTVVDSLAVDKPLRLALDCAFRRSDFLYGPELQTMFGDSEVRDLMRDKFRRLARPTLSLSRQRLVAHEEGRQDNPMPFPHTTCEIYDRTLFVAAPSGVAKAGAGGRTKHPISTRVERLWDAPVVDMAASWGSLALAAGDDGLFEMGLYDSYWGHSPSRHPDPPQIADMACTKCDWTFHSVFGSAPDGGFMAKFRKGSPDRDDELTHRDRTFERLVTAEELWGRSGFAWGVQDKLCLAASNNEIHVLKYQPWKDHLSEQIRPIGVVRTHPWKGEVVSASTAPFGVVVELENALVVYPSVGDPVTLAGEPVNWRVFPRARHYQNQLHVVWNDRLEILSFNQDYLADQDTKTLGVSVFGTTSRARERRAYVE